MKCRITKCRANCCYNVPFEHHELVRFADKIVTQPVEYEYLMGSAILPHVIKIEKPEDIFKNKCPFLRHDCTCNIYENRPEICRLYGQIDRLPCEYRKK